MPQGLGLLRGWSRRLVELPRLTKPQACAACAAWKSKSKSGSGSGSSSQQRRASLPRSWLGEERQLPGTLAGGAHLALPSSQALSPRKCGAALPRPPPPRATGSCAQAAALSPRRGHRRLLPTASQLLTLLVMLSRGAASRARQHLLLKPSPPTGTV